MFEVAQSRHSLESNIRGPEAKWHILFYIRIVEYLVVIKNNEDIYIYIYEIKFKK